MKKTLLFLPLLLGACASSITDARMERYEGFYTWGFEENGFRPCGSEESWWVTEGDLHSRYADVASQQYEAVYVELSGTVGPEGEYGHLGAYSRELAVEELHEMRPAQAGDCR